MKILGSLLLVISLFYSCDQNLDISRASLSVDKVAPLQYLFTGELLNVNGGSDNFNLLGLDDNSKMEFSDVVYELNGIEVQKGNIYSVDNNFEILVTFPSDRDYSIIDNNRLIFRVAGGSDFLYSATSFIFTNDQ